MKRSYAQFCALARALDVVGERWTLLVVRELLFGPRRYSDLLAALPGIGTNLLAARLRELSDAGIVRRSVLPPPAGARVYELTERGRALEPVLVALVRWGMQDLAPPAAEDRRQAGWFLLALRAAWRDDALAGAAVTLELRLDGEAFRATAGRGSLDLHRGAPERPDAVLEADLDTFLAAVTGRATLRELEDAGRAAVTGDRGAVGRFLVAARLPDPLTPAG